MSFGTVQQGPAGRYYVGTSAPPSVLLGGLQGFGYTNNKATTLEEFYNLFPSVTAVGSATRSITFRVKYAKSDSGQDIIKTNFDLATPTVIYSSLLLDGTTGEYLPCICTEWSATGGGSQTMPDIAITLSAQGDPVDVSGGY